MNRTTPALLALGLAACLQEGTETTTSTTEQASTTCLPGGAYCKALLPAPSYYNGTIPTLTEDYQAFIVYDCNGSFFGAVADTKQGRITWHSDVTKALGDFMAKATVSTNQSHRALVKVPTPPHPHCPLAGEILFYAKGAQDLATTAFDANDLCLQGN